MNIKTHIANGNTYEYIKFKCPANLNKATDKTLPKMINKIENTISLNSQEFAGVDVAKMVTGKSDFVLKYQEFTGADGKTYGIYGVNTECATGFSIIIQRKVA